MILLDNAHDNYAYFKHITYNTVQLSGELERIHTMSLHYVMS